MRTFQDKLVPVNSCPPIWSSSCDRPLTESGLVLAAHRRADWSGGGSLSDWPGDPLPLQETQAGP